MILDSGRIAPMGLMPLMVLFAGWPDWPGGTLAGAWAVIPEIFVLVTPPVAPAVDVAGMDVPAALGAGVGPLGVWP